MMKKLVLVETISQYRVRYAIEVEDDIDHALDTVVWDGDTLEELSQKHMGEFPISHREITGEEYLQIFDKDNDGLKVLNEKQKKEFICVIKYDKDEKDGKGHQSLHL